MTTLIDISLFNPRKPREPPLSLETILVSSEYFGLAKATPLQRAICRVLDGLPIEDLAEDPDVNNAFGGLLALANLPMSRPSEFILLAGIRCGKSLIAGACAVRAALTCDLSPMGLGEPAPRVSVLSYSIDTARATWGHIYGHVKASPKLNALLVKEPTADMLILRHPSGSPIEIKVVAGSRAAGGVVSRWSAGVIFDEAPRMVGSEDGVVNLDDARQAVAGRLLPGAQVLMIGSPWAPFGPVYTLVENHFARPSKHLVIVRAPAFALNPSWWTPERCDDLRTQSPDAYAVDVLCSFLNPVSGLFTIEELRDVSRDLPMDLPANERYSYSVGMDPATRGNGWALVVTTNLGKIDGREKYAVALSRQWVGSTVAPLDSRKVFQEIATLLRPYGVTKILTDQWGFDNLRIFAADVGLLLVEKTLTRAEKFELYDNLKKRVVDRALELPPNQILLRDLASVKKKVTQQGLAIELPDGADGRHADYAAALVLALSQTVFSPAPEKLSPEEAARDEASRLREQAKNEVRQKMAQQWRGIR